MASDPINPIPHPVRNWRLLALIALCVVAYLPGIAGGFLFDDFSNIVNNAALQNAAHGKPDWLAIALISDGGQRRPLSMLSFALNAIAFGMNPLSFKLANLVIHLVNGLLVFALSRRIADRLTYPDRTEPRFRPDTLALFSTALWLLHPLNVSGVLYVMQRMNELSSMFILIGLFCYVEGRTRMLRRSGGLFEALTGLCVFGLIATACKENGALIVGYAWIVEILCFRFEASLRERRILKAIFWAAIAVPIFLFCLYLCAHPDMLGYSRNGFTLYTRVLSEARVLCDYLLWFFVPLPSLMGFHHDDIAVSQGLLNPISTAASITFWITLSISAWLLRRRCPGFAFAVTWFLVGHSIESSIFGLELVFEHRNYLPMTGLLLGTVCALAQMAPNIQFPRYGITGTMVAVVGLLAFATAVRAHDWRSPFALAMADATHHPMSSRAQYEAGRQIVIDGDRNNALKEAKEKALPYFDRAAEIGPYELFPAVARVQIRSEYGTVPPTELEDLARRLRSAQSSEQANAFLDMLIAASQTTLSLTPSDMSALMTAALENSQWRATVRAMMLNNYGSYLFNIPRDYQSAINMTMAAAAAEPRNPYFQINLAKIALAVNDLAAAREHLAAAKELNKAGVYDQEIARIERQVNPTRSK